MIQEWSHPGPFVALTHHGASIMAHLILAAKAMPARATSTYVRDRTYKPGLNSGSSELKNTKRKMRRRVSCTGTR